MASLPSTIRAINQLDPKSTTLTMLNKPLPTPKDPEDHLIRVMAASPCLGELYWEVRFPQLFDPNRERVPGTECAGVIAALPDDGPSEFKVGDEVYFRLAVGRTGTMREYTFAKPAEMARKPASLSWTDAAATPLSSLTAWQGLFNHGILDKRAVADSDSDALAANSKLRVLITGASGGVGSWSVQFASAAGAGTIAGLCSASQVSSVRGLGATETIDYTTQSLSAWVAEDRTAREFDLVIDNVGGATLAACWDAMKDGGVLLSIVGNPEASKPESASGKTLAKAAWYLVEPSGADLSDISRLIDLGKCRPNIDSVYEFEDFAKAFEKVESGKPKGKVVVRIGA
ncbi:NAD(P)-binding protein [Paramyrothecium foliicola]|nr:NAD(P)-binding protein [Paramyrothecium foliicola]